MFIVDDFPPFVRAHIYAEKNEKKNYLTYKLTGKVLKWAYINFTLFIFAVKTLIRRRHIT